MSFEIRLDKNTDRQNQYEVLLPQIESLLEGESDSVASLANICAALKDAFDFLWVGFYRVLQEELVLGPFQGPVACTRIQYGKGVCGKAWEQKSTIVVDDVSSFPGHIACSAESQSEIVVPIFSDAKVVGVLDIDSEFKAHFNSMDQKFIEDLVRFIEKKGIFNAK
jgi:GAF domain-containing protein